MPTLTASYTISECKSTVGLMVNVLDGRCYRKPCGSWNCASCGQRNVRRFMRRIKTAGEYRYLVTLTLDGDVFDVRDCGRRLAAGWRALYQFLRRRGVGHYAWVRERGSRSGRLHLHAIVQCARFDYRAARAVLARSPVGRVCDFQRLRRASRGGAARYISKYLVKGVCSEKFPRYFRRCQTSVRREVGHPEEGWRFERDFHRRATVWTERDFGLSVTPEELLPDTRQLSLALTKKEKLWSGSACFGSFSVDRGPP